MSLSRGSLFLLGDGGENWPKTGYPKEQSVDGPEPQLGRSSLLSQQSHRSVWTKSVGGHGDRRGKSSSPFYLLGVFMGIRKSEVWEKKVSLLTVKNHILISNRKTRIRGYLSSTLSASHVAELMGAICGGCI